MSSFGFSTTSEEVIERFAAEVKGRIFLITGTSANGLGAHTALSLARKSPAQLILVSRTKSKVDPVIEAIAAIDPSIKTTFIACELSDLESVRRVADTINNDASIPHIDVVINNAGVMDVKEFTKSPQGIELTFASNHIGHFLLTSLLMPKIKTAGSGARVVNLTSSGHKVSPVRFDDYNFSDGAAYDGWSAYGQSKTAAVLFSLALARRGVKSFAVHPGTIFETGLATHLEMSDLADLSDIAERNTGRPFQIDNPKSLTQGSATTLVAALSPEMEGRSGAFLADCQVGTPYEYASDKANADKLWLLSEKLIGEKFNL